METFGVVPEISWSSFELEDREVMEQLLGPYVDSPYNDSGAYCCFLPSCAHQSQNCVPMVFPSGGDHGSDPNYAYEEPLSEARNTEFCEPSLSSGGASRLREKKTKASMVACKGSSKTKRARKIDEVIDNNEEGNAGLELQCTSSGSSKNDSCASKELKGGNAPLGARVPTAMKGKASAGRAATTDPQSVYARRRRERINERLRILQKLIPNGNKVDISTMLEEAVKYVKFLQLQIRLLSSDELWMYAPLAYNGMNMGLLDLLNPSSKQ